MKPSQFIPFGKVDEAYDELHANLEFAYKRAKVLADTLGISIHESPEVTGTILGLVRGGVERLLAEIAFLKEELCDKQKYILHLENSRSIDCNSGGSR